ncbi:MAG: hypothetical protein D6696_08260 [Acidobacteria bacterium]|nr:MAG: hypothetical protein D6696_08260 [Acidobacteriota bacterium]
MRRLLAGLAFLLLLVLAAVWHLRAWYRPRARAALPPADSAVAALLDSPRFPAVLWLPYPHQNLGTIAPEEGQDDFLQAFARLSGLPPPVLPSFGGFAVVPASELALASDERGEHFVVMARVYPLLAAFSRFAGRLADNPWLAGGPVTIRGRPARVLWRDDVWIVYDAASTPPPEAPPRAAAPAGRGEPSLAILALHREVPPFPAGRYHLRHRHGGLEVSSQTPVPEGLWQRAARLVEPDLVLVVLAGSAAGGGAHALAFFAQDAASRSLPHAAAFNPLAGGAADEPWSVPGRGVARLAGQLAQTTAAGFRVEALGPTSLARARRLAPRLASLDRAEPQGTSLRWGLWSDLRSNLVEVERLAGLLEEMPLVPRREAARWRDAARVLAPLAGRFDNLVIVVAGAPSAFRLRLAERPADRRAAEATAGGGEAAAIDSVRPIPYASPSVREAL